MNSDIIVADRNGFIIDPSCFIAIFQLQHTPGAHRCANSATYARCPCNVLTPLCIPFNINSHLAIGRTVAAGNALPAIGGDSEP